MTVKITSKENDPRFQPHVEIFPYDPQNPTSRKRMSKTDYEALADCRTAATSFVGPSKCGIGETICVLRFLTEFDVVDQNP